MTHEQTALWHRIRDFQIDAPDASFPFSSRLARENGWTPAYARRVIDEYRKFTFLSIAAGHGVTPSKPVDEAWHLHLLYTRNYWEEFCPHALGRPLHHNPSGGTAEDESKYEGWYEQTLSSYERLFGGPPPGDIWPNGQTPPKPKRAWWLLFVPTALMLGGCGETANPLEWRGPEFLQFFALLYGVCLLAAVLIRQAFRGNGDGPPANDWQLSIYEKAYLNEGRDLALATAVANLTAQNLLEVDRKKGRMRSTGNAKDRKDPLERAILRAAESLTGANYQTIRRVVGPHLDEIETSLRRQSLWVNGDSVTPSILLPFLVASLPVLLGGAKILVGIERDRPVGILVFGCIAALALNCLFFQAPKRSRYGDAVLDEFRRAKPNGQFGARWRNAPPDELALGVALFGLTALEGGEFAYLQPMVRPVPASLSNGGSTCGAASSCSGGGGSCGGGGCGGGCGGCGS
ncbi:TIGR04222 domain-containing membrane protein [bacterium]|nr:MAG: TIGR04222 domain-containing membrane protein [bacterium]